MTTLSTDNAMQIVIDAIAAVAPDVAAELPALDRTVDLWEELQLDSMDHLTVMTTIWEQTGIEIAERDYAQLRSLDALATHLSSRTQ